MGVEQPPEQVFTLDHRHPVLEAALARRLTWPGPLLLGVNKKE